MQNIRSPRKMFHIVSLHNVCCKRVVEAVDEVSSFNWHVLHPDAVTKGFVHPSRGMLLCCYFELMLFLHVYSNLSSKLAEISSSLVRSSLYTYCFLTVCSVICCSQFGYNDHVQGTPSYYGPYSCDVWQQIWTEESPWPPWAYVVRATFWTSQLYEGLRAKLLKPRVTPNIEKADGGHIGVQLGDTVIETATGKVLKEEGRLEVLPLSFGCPVPTFMSALPFVCCLIEVRHMWTLAVHNIVPQFLLNGVLIAVTGETAHVPASVGNLKVAWSEEFFHADVCVYNLSKASAVYSMGQSALALYNLHPLSSRLPRYMSFTQGTLSNPLPVEIVCFLLCHLI